MTCNPFIAKHSWKTVLVQIVEGLEDGSVVLPGDASLPQMEAITVGPEEISRWRDAAPFRPFRVVTKDNAVYEVERPDLLMVGLTAVVIGRPAPGAPGKFSQCETVELSRVARLERGDESFDVR